ncbi:MAG: hypothetical protein WD579_00410 [Candidatus Paceibacterota bacterium]
MKSLIRILVLVLLLLVTTLLIGCGDSGVVNDPPPNNQPTPEEEEYTPTITVTSTDTWMIVPGPGKTTSFEVDVSVEDTLHAITVEYGSETFDTTAAEGENSLSFSREIPVESMAGATLTITATGATGESQEIFTLENVEETLTIADATTGPNEYGIYHINNESGEYQQLFGYSATYGQHSPFQGFAVSPDGSEVFIFDLQEGSNCNHLLTLDYRGELTEDLGENCTIQGRVIMAQWLPDGRIAYMNAHDSGSPEVFTLDPHTGNITEYPKESCSDRPEDAPFCFGVPTGFASDTDTGTLYISAPIRRYDGREDSDSVFNITPTSMSGLYQTERVGSRITVLTDVRVTTASLMRLEEDEISTIFVDLEAREELGTEAGIGEFAFGTDGSGISILYEGDFNQLIFFEPNGNRRDPVTVEGLRNIHPRLLL